MSEITGTTVRDRWKVSKKLGEGGFGAVFEVFDTQSQETFAMKTENIKERHQVLKMEVAVLRRLQGKPHVCRFIACGRNEKFNYLIMTMVGKNLGDLKHETPEGCLSVGSGIRLGFQCTQALEDLHAIGFLHRDVKPSNFAIGRHAHSCRTVYVLDFGLARQFVNPQGEIRTPRSTAGFRGTVRYASISCHINQELGRHDDLWSLFYMMVEFIIGKLPWRRITNKEEVGKVKQSTPSAALLKGCPSELESFYRHIKGLTYVDKPNYAYLYKIFDRILKRYKVKDDDPFDWESEDPPEVRRERKQTSSKYRRDKDKEKQERENTENEVEDPYGAADK